MYRRMLKMQNDELEQSALTFQPKLSTYAENAKSKLQLNNDPSLFLDWFETIAFELFVYVCMMVSTRGSINMNGGNCCSELGVFFRVCFSKFYHVIHWMMMNRMIESLCRTRRRLPRLLQRLHRFVCILEDDGEVR